jgi:hypothetical protein
MKEWIMFSILSWYRISERRKHVIGRLISVKFPINKRKNKTGHTSFTV